MLSKWKVRQTEVAGSTFYQVYRTTDAAKAKNQVETHGGFWNTFNEAQKLADRLNEEGK